MADDETEWDVGVVVIGMDDEDAGRWVAGVRGTLAVVTGRSSVVDC